MRTILYILFIALSISCNAQIVYIGGVSAGAGAGGVSVTTPTMNTTSANFIEIGVADFQPNAVCLVTDSKLNTWVVDTSVNDGTLTRGRLFHCLQPCSTATNQSFTIGSGCASQTFPSIIVGAWSGVATSSPMDVRNAAAITVAATSGQGGSITPTQNNELVITFVSENGATTPPTIPSGYTSIATIGAVASQHLGAGMAFKTQTTASAENPTWTFVLSKATIINQAVKAFSVANTNQGFFLLMGGQ